jgi:large subunit ribosomal protein L30
MAKTQAKKVTSAQTLTVYQFGSPYGQKPGMVETLRGLGLGRVRRTRQLEDTPSVRGMIEKVRHLVRIVEGK